MIASCSSALFWMLKTNLLSNCLFFFIYTATSQIYTLSLHDALPIYWSKSPVPEEYSLRGLDNVTLTVRRLQPTADRKSTRLNSSHVRISYAVFCLKKKSKNATLLR